MPYTTKAATKGGAAKRHTRKADTPKKQRQWAHVFNSIKERGGSESKAFAGAASAVKKSSKRPSSNRKGKKQ